MINKITNYSILEILRTISYKFFKTRLIKLHYLKTNIDLDRITSELEKIDFEIKELNYSDFLLGDKTVFNKKKLNLIKNRCNDNTYKAYGIISENILIYSTWISLEKLGLPIKYSYNLNLNEGLLEDSYCHPTARGRGIHSKMNFYRLKKILEHGKSKGVAIVFSENTPALKVQFKSGFQLLGSFYVGEVFGIPFSTLNKKKYDNR